MPAAVLFDFNSTLIKSRKWIELEVRDLPRAAFARLAEESHVEPLDSHQLASAEAIFSAARAAANTTFRETSHVDDLKAMVEALDYQDRVSERLIEETVAVLHRACLPSVVLMDEVTETLQGLKEMGLRMSIISNAAYAPFLGWTLNQFDIGGFFEDVLVSADVRVRKPDPKIFELALGRLNLQPGETVYVGDDFVKDIAPSIRLGMRGIWYHPREEDIRPDLSPAPDAIVRGHAEILPLVAQWA